MNEIDIDWSGPFAVCECRRSKRQIEAYRCAGCKHWRWYRQRDAGTFLVHVNGGLATHVRCAYVTEKPCRVCDGRTRVTACDPGGNPIPSAPIVPCPRCEGTGKEPIADGV